MSLARVRGLRPIELGLLAAHALLLIFAVAAVAGSALSTGWRAGLACAAVAPLALAFPGLLRGRRRTHSWAALLMVLFAGGATVEVVASQGRAPLVSVVLLAALVELALLFLISRSGGRSAG